MKLRPLRVMICDISQNSSFSSYSCFRSSILEVISTSWTLVLPDISSSRVCYWFCVLTWRYTFSISNYIQYIILEKCIITENTKFYLTQLNHWNYLPYTKRLYLCIHFYMACNAALLPNHFMPILRDKVWWLIWMDLVGRINYVVLIFNLWLLAIWKLG